MVLSDPVAKEEMKQIMRHCRKTKKYTYKKIFIYKLGSVTMWHYQLLLRKRGLQSHQKAVFEYVYFWHNRQSTLTA